MQGTHQTDVGQWLLQLRLLSRDNMCAGPDFWRPFHFVTLGLQIARTGRSGLTIPPAFVGYASRMGLWDAIGLETPAAVNARDPHGKFVPLQRLDNADRVHELSVKLADICRAFGADKETLNSLEISLQEIMDNCFAHAGISVDLQGLACAQSWPRGNLAQIAIADIGVGIRRSLAANADLLDQLAYENSCELATRFGVTGKPGMGHAGYGLALTRQLLQANGGTLLVQSGDEWVRISGQNISVGLSPYNWAGTLVLLEWDCSKPLRVKDVYRSWPAPTGFSDDDFDFPI